MAGRRFVLDGDVAADVGDAEAALLKLDASAAALAGTEALAGLLLRAESVASSRIEGLEVGGRRLLRADAARQLGEASRDVTALEVLGNIDAMVWGVDTVEPGRPITVDTLLEAHRRLLAGTRLEGQGGRLRTLQNWIGGSAYNPCAAEFVPPPPEAVAGLLDDLLAFCNDDSLPALGQAAIAHAQFETIHPFVDGNGTDRAGADSLRPATARPRTARPAPGLTLVLATWSRDYIAGLTGTRYVGPPDSAEAHAGTNRWIALFAAACRRAVEDATRFEAQVRALQAAWVERAGRPRRDSAARRLIEALPAAPVLTASTAAQAHRPLLPGRRQAIDRLVSARRARAGQHGRAQPHLRRRPS